MNFYYLLKDIGKHRSKVIFIVLAAMLLIFNLIVYNDCRLYKTPIAKVVSAKISNSRTISGELEIKEPQYEQTLTCILQNGNDYGKPIITTNMYTYTHMDNDSYHKGDFLFLENIKSNTDGTLSAAITGQKRDYFLSFLLTLLLFGAVVVAGKRGFSFFVALFMNIGILILGFICFQTGISFILITIIMILLFSTLSLGICIGWNWQMIVTLADTLLSVGILAAIYCIALKATPEVDYALLDYVNNGMINLEIMFTCGTLLGSLGAIMDVAVSVTSGIAEILQKEPEISDKSLSKSARQIGYDVMGTMINVLFYTYLVGRIPVCLAQLANGIQVGIMIKYYMVYEIIRFLAGAIGIVLCVPISEFIARNYYRKKVYVK
jgi:uncharacterized membrane protein